MSRRGDGIRDQPYVDEGCKHLWVTQIDDRQYQCRDCREVFIMYDDLTLEEVTDGDIDSVVDLADRRRRDRSDDWMYVKGAKRKRHDRDPRHRKPGEKK